MMKILTQKMLEAQGSGMACQYLVVFREPSQFATFVTLSEARSLLLAGRGYDRCDLYQGMPLGMPQLAEIRSAFRGRILEACFHQAPSGPG